MTDRKMTQNKEDRDIARAFYNTYQGGHWILAAGTTYAGWYFTKTLGGQLFGAYTLYVAIAAGLFAYYLLDNQVLKFAPRAIAFVLSGFGVKGKAAQVNQKSRANKIFDLMVVSVFALMLAASFYSNTIIVPDISGEITGDADTSTEKRSMGGNNATYERELTGYEEQVKTAKDALVSAKAARDADVNSAVNSELRRLAAKPKDEWAKGEIVRLQASASRKHDRAIRKAQTALLSAQKDYKAFVSSQGGKVKDANMLLAEVVEKKEAKQENKFSRWHGWLSIVMYTGLALFLFGCIGWQCYQIDTGDNIVSDLTTGKVLSAFKSKAGQGANAGLARALGVRDRVEFQVNGNGTMSATLPRTASRTDSLGRTLSPAQIRERDHWERDVERQTNRYPEQAEQNLDRNWTEIETETEKRTERGQNEDRTEKQAQTSDGVGDGSYPNPNDKEAMKAFTKRLRAASAYNANDPRVTREINWMRSQGWRCEPRDGGKWIITRPASTGGQVENEFAWDVLGNGENSEA
jgi:ribosomal protein S12